MLIRIPKGWEIAERDAAREDVYKNRRRFLKGLGVAGLAGAAAAAGLSDFDFLYRVSADGKFPSYPPLPAPRNGKYTVDRPIPKDELVSLYNNFYEFTTDLDRVWKVARDFPSRPWEIEITGEVEKKRKIDVDDLMKKLRWKSAFIATAASRPGR